MPVAHENASKFWCLTDNLTTVGCRYFERSLKIPIKFLQVQISVMYSEYNSSDSYHDYAYHRGVSAETVNRHLRWCNIMLRSFYTYQFGLLYYANSRCGSVNQIWTKMTLLEISVPMYVWQIQLFKSCQVIFVFEYEFNGYDEN